MTGNTPEPPPVATSRRPAQKGTLPDPLWTDAADLCVGCGYSLAGLVAPGTCPECGAAFEARQLVLCGVVRGTGHASPGRKLAWIGAGLLGFATSQAFVIAQATSWLVAAFIAVCAAVSIVWLLATGPRDRRGSERFVFTSAGVGCVPIDPNRARADDASGFVPWNGADALKIDRVSAFWKRVRVFAPAEAGAKKKRVIFDAGVRCPDDRTKQVETSIRSLIAGETLAEPPPEFVPKHPPLAPPRGPAVTPPG